MSTTDKAAKLLRTIASDTSTGIGRLWQGLDFGAIDKVRRNNRRNKNQKRMRGMRKN